MKEIGGLPFPETQTEAAEWESTTTRRTLARHVLVVATTRIEGTWAAYCMEVPGKNYDVEEVFVLHSGDKLPESWARAMFPIFDDIPYSQ